MRAKGIRSEFTRNAPSRSTNTSATHHGLLSVSSFATFASFKRESSDPPSLKSAVFVDDFHIESSPRAVTVPVNVSYTAKKDAATKGGGTSWGGKQTAVVPVLARQQPHGCAVPLEEEIEVKEFLTTFHM